jgi:hypothetical protein
MSNPDNSFYFAGVGFTQLNLTIGTTNYGTLSDGSNSQLLSNITFDDATGAVSFDVGESPTNVRSITFSGNVINDDSGYAIGFTGTWQGVRMPIIMEESAAAAAKSGPAIREEPALGIFPPPIYDVGGSWAAVVMPQ